MEEFEDFKRLWQQPTPPPPVLDVARLKKANQSAQRKLERTQLWSAVALILTTGWVAGVGFMSDFKSSLTYVATGLLALIPLGQGLINLSVYRRLRRLDVAAPAAEHLRQWEAYYQFRRRLVRYNGPLYTLALSAALGLYYLEFLPYFSLVYKIVLCSVTLGWILFAYFVLGRRTLRKEYARLEEIMDNLKKLQQQIEPDSEAESTLS
ncbi:hypothetical protein HNQ92_004932 [Rhabdobacter roseus]|uniref:Uncharacterized protein n=1 Tax=Rhabdobacter roseus TaxID=1655419 RepID=A0A840TS48_9BACT|nr:hypothetical protein [Rhabdobacter roseus]MBB5286771.1 hypothetical protein [Rhabdobacter roseus]